MPTDDLSMLDWAGEPLRDLLIPMLEVAKQVTTLSQRCGQDTGRPDWGVVEVWTNVQQNGGVNEAHSHPGSFWAGVYYLDVGELFHEREGRRVTD